MNEVPKKKSYNVYGITFVANFQVNTLKRMKGIIQIYAVCPHKYETTAL